MKGTTVFYIFIGFTLTVLLGVYLSETATNDMLGTAAPPQMMALVPQTDGTWLIKFLGQTWELDPAATRAKSIELISKACHTLQDYWVRTLAR